MRIHNLLLLTAFIATSLHAQTTFRLSTFATGFARPVDIAHAGDSRLYIVEQRGQIWILDNRGQRVGTEPFLNIMDRVRDAGNEQGLLGLAFHPNYAQNGFFYVNYTRETDGDTRVSRFTRSATNANAADPASELILLEYDQPFTNHNGGGVKFGPDGFLYVSSGDGGSGGDPLNTGQNPNSLLGKILRIDVNGRTGNLNYAIPADNPFANTANVRPEIWSLGWRNPWRFSFDRQTGDMWVGDVGQDAREEVSFEPARTGGRNYGWRCYEGTRTFNTNNCQPIANYTGAIFDYATNRSINGDGCSVTGGFVYRGRRFPNLFGLYLVTDYCSGRWWSIRRETNGTFTSAVLSDQRRGEFSSLGEDIDGELYAAGLATGQIYRIEGQTVSTGEQSEAVRLFSVQPNPTYDYATVTLTLDKLYRGQLTVLDGVGRVVSEQPVQQREGIYVLDMSKQPAGIYFVKVQADGRTLAVRKVVKLM
jgi:glucose/arabinose dehydrogenase